MKAAIRYFSLTGNTKKLAEAIAAELGMEAKGIMEPLEEEAELVFLCNSVYWAGIDKRVKQFVKANADKIHVLVNVSTAAMIESTYGQMKKVAADAGVKLCEKEFHCRGKFAALHSGHPDAEDLKAVREFAREIIA
ncbi:MAG: flavodoxin [Oscillospiraceae bacterium]|nr:flavodoxin [Oscillospiraceae bacterium]